MLPAGDIYDIIEALDAGYGYGQAGRTAANTSNDAHGHDYYRLDVVQRDAGGFVAASRAWLEAQQEQGGLGQQGQEVLGVQGQEGGAEGAGSQGVEGRGRRRRPVPSWSGLDPDPERMALKLAFQGKACENEHCVRPGYACTRTASGAFTSPGLFSAQLQLSRTTLGPSPHHTTRWRQPAEPFVDPLLAATLPRPAHRT